jgi:glyoxylase-like metal-dependent hydrolase (beta-lactamase superfamily II)
MALQAPAAISLGLVSVFLVPADWGCVLVDAGVPGQEGRILAGLAKHGLGPDAVRLIFVTHAHGDHVGSLHALAERTAAPVLVHRSEAPALASGVALRPHGLTTVGKIAAALTGRFATAASGRPCQPDIEVDEERSLADFGVRGRAIHTPRHTAGSLSLLLDSGEAFVGDLCANYGVVSRGSYVPMFGEDRQAVYASWSRLLDAGATRLYPSHGAPFPASALKAELARVRPGV